ncbi:MAG TPA: DegT/DnrJ/EryC1/StrS family aminotransferase [Phycisphaerae bacterium]|nr:DegT/DnrJ/EryC1/StrS family aminotransferase [Phycisphaerae bacterium]
MVVKERVPLARPDISQDDIDAVVAVLKTPYLSLGPKLPEFERAFAEFLGLRHAVAVNSGTSALHLIVRALGLGPGDEMITSPFTFVATANCALFEGAKPVFVDIDEKTWNMDTSKIEAAVTERTKLLMPVHIFGRPMPMDAVMRIGEKHRLPVVEDACEALGATYKGRKAGAFALASTFAFYPNKQMTTGEGGMVVTDDDRLADLCRSMRNQGRDPSGGWLAHARLGYNYRLSDLNCALGLSQLARLPQFVAARARVADRYIKKLADVDELVMPAPCADGTMSWFVFVIRLADRFSQKQRDAVLDHLRGQGIGTNNYFSPVHLQPFYREQFGYKPGDFPVTEKIAARTIALPFYNRLSEKDQDLVVKTLKDALVKL